LFVFGSGSPLLIGTATFGFLMFVFTGGLDRTFGAFFERTSKQKDIRVRVEDEHVRVDGTELEHDDDVEDAAAEEAPSKATRRS
jgi:hypothetical protein